MRDRDKRIARGERRLGNGHARKQASRRMGRRRKTRKTGFQLH